MSKFIVTDEAINEAEKATGHSVYGGSSVPRIVECPASVGEGLQVPPKPESVYAAEGTLLHDWMEKSRKAANPREYLLDQDLSIERTALLLDASDFVDEIIELHPDDSYEIFLEQTGSLQSYGLPEVWGTGDVVIKSALRTDIIDYKFGYGVANYAIHNLQLVTYLGMAEPFEVVPPEDRELHVHICQPPKQIFDSWELDYQKLYELILGDITDAIALSRTPSPRYGPSEKACRFCSANMRCKERHAFLRDNALMIQRMAQNPSQVTNEDWAKFLEGAKAVKSAISQVEKFAVSEIMGGHDFPSYKLVQGKSNRKFRDQKEGEGFLIRRLGEEAYTVKAQPVITLAQAEKVDPSLKKDDEWKELVYKPEGAAKLVHQTAKGEAMKFGTAALLDEIAAQDSGDMPTFE